MHYEGPKRSGRFIKGGSKVSEKVSLVDFSFKEINDAKTITLDNSSRTLVHAQYHAKEELAEAVTPPEKFNDDLTTRELMRPVIFPMDFTKEWERDKKLRKDRVSRQDDEEFDYELEAARLKQQEDAAAESEEAVAADEAAPRKPAAPAPVAAPKSEPLTKPTQWESMNVVGAAIKGFMTTDAADNLPSTPVPAAPAPTPAAKATSEFIPVVPQPAPAPHAAGADAPAAPVAYDLEAAAAAEYKERVERLKQEEIALQARMREIEDEAKAKGYRDGLRLGEEKAELQARQHAAQLFGKVTELIHEFGNLKADVLNNVQENFYELSQAMAESLVKREFSIHPETFVAVLRRAIAEAVEPGKFKIRVNPETYERVASLGQSDILESLVRDNEIATGDFKIESQLSVVDVSITKMISELLQQADLNLFQTEKKVG